MIISYDIIKQPLAVDMGAKNKQKYGKKYVKSFCFYMTFENNDDAVLTFYNVKGIDIPYFR